MPDWLDLETAILLAVLVGLVFWALRKRQTYRLKRNFRVYPDDLRSLVHYERGKENWLFGMERIDWDEGSELDGRLIYKGGMIGIMKQKIDPESQRVASSIDLITTGDRPGERLVSTASIEPHADGAQYLFDMSFERIGPLGFKGWVYRLLRPISMLSFGSIINAELVKSGAIARYAADHGEAPAQRSVLGMSISRNALLLAVFALGWWAWSFGIWPTVALAVGLVLHEAGHVAVMRMLGDRASMFYFVPFLGGVAIGKMPHKSDLEHFLMVFGGPFAGLLSAAIAGLIGWWFGNSFFLACGLFFALVNLLNLLPIPPLDGGQMTMVTFRPVLSPNLLQALNIGLMAAGAALCAWYQITLLAIIFTLLCVLAIAMPQQHVDDARKPFSKVGAAGALFTFLLLAG
ncbi:MAG: hypothetical protein ACRC56_00535, partial [Bosea sp. (in: a-proteobacteria)]